MSFASAFTDDMCVLSSQFMYSCAELPFQEPVVAVYESTNDARDSGYASEDVESELSNEESHFYQGLLETSILQQLDLESLMSKDFFGSPLFQEALEAYIDYKMEEDYDW